MLGIQCIHNLQIEGSSMSVVSVRVTDEMDQQLKALAAATGRTPSWLAGQAMQDYLKREMWQVAEIEQAIIEADAGDFASDAEVAASAKKWGSRAS